MVTGDRIDQLCESLGVNRQTFDAAWEVVCINNAIDENTPSSNEHLNLIRDQIKSNKEKTSTLKLKSGPRLKNSSNNMTSTSNASYTTTTPTKNWQSKSGTPFKDLTFSNTVNRSSGNFYHTANDYEKSPLTPKKSSLLSTANETSKSSPFLSRKEKLHLISSYNEHIPFDVTDEIHSNPPTVALLHELQSYRYGFASMEADDLNDRIEMFETIFAEEKEVETQEMMDVADHEEDDTLTFVGMICSDALDTNMLNYRSVMLQTSRRRNLRVKLNLESLKEFSLFPGQIVQVTGKYNSVNEFQVLKLRMPNLLPTPATSVAEIKYKNYEPLNYIIASGPFTLAESLLFEPLDEFVQYVVDKKPNLVILTGPFLAENHPILESGNVDMHLTEIFKLMIASKINRIVSNLPQTKVIVIPSVFDIVSDTPCLPQPALNGTQLGLHPSILCFSNPVQFSVDNIVFAVTSEDVIRPLAAGEIVLNIPQDRMARLVKHLLSQRNFTPVFPLPFKCYDPALEFMATPDILILPSAIKAFVKDVDGCMVINPSTTCKAMSSGTFVHGIIHPFDAETLDNVDSKEDIPAFVEKRMRTDILRL